MRAVSYSKRNIMNNVETNLFDGNDCVAGEYSNETVVAMMVVVVVVGLIFGFLVAKWQG